MALDHSVSLRSSGFTRSPCNKPKEFCWTEGFQSSANKATFQGRDRKVQSATGNWEVSYAQLCQQVKYGSYTKESWNQSEKEENNFQIKVNSVVVSIVAYNSKAVSGSSSVKFDASSKERKGVLNTFTMLLLPWFQKAMTFYNHTLQNIFAVF